MSVVLASLPWKGITCQRWICQKWVRVLKSAQWLSPNCRSGDRREKKYYFEILILTRLVSLTIKLIRSVTISKTKSYSSSCYATNQTENKKLQQYTAYGWSIGWGVGASLKRNSLTQTLGNKYKRGKFITNTPSNIRGGKEEVKEERRFANKRIIKYYMNKLHRYSTIRVVNNRVS